MSIESSQNRSNACWEQPDSSHEWGGGYTSDYGIIAVDGAIQFIAGGMCKLAPTEAAEQEVA